MRKRESEKINGLLILILIVLTPVAVKGIQICQENGYAEDVFSPTKDNKSFADIHHSPIRKDTGGISSFHRITLGVPVSINGESEEGLTAIPGIGPKLARAIIKEREKRGGFNDLREIGTVYGVGRDLLKRIMKYVEL